MYNIFTLILGNKVKDFKVVFMIYECNLLYQKKKLLSILFSILLLLSFSACGGSEDIGGHVRGFGSGNDSARQIELTWEAPTLNEDYTPYNDPSGYKVYYGSSSGNYTDQVDVSHSLCQDNGASIECSAVITGLNQGEYYVAVTAYDTSGNESDYSNEVIKKST